MRRRRKMVVTVTRSRGYSFGAFLFDIFMTCITSGLWLIWVIIR